ncbi:ABC-type polysaccharide/polyol phosphate transport system ATPase subunit [Bradyrhizobium japonicum]
MSLAAHIVLRNVSVNFPVLSFRDRSLRSRFVSVDGEIVLLDEWIGVGDQQFRRKARQRLDEIVARAGILVLASHDIELIQSTCNRAILLEEGRITAAGPTDAILAKYLAGSGAAKA